MKTQEAYELAVNGLIRPMGKSPPIITAIRCLQFALPEFQLGRTGTNCIGEVLAYIMAKTLAKFSFSFVTMQNELVGTLTSTSNHSRDA